MKATATKTPTTQKLPKYPVTNIPTSQSQRADRAVAESGHRNGAAVLAYNMKRVMQILARIDGRHAGLRRVLMRQNQPAQMTTGPRHGSQGLIPKFVGPIQILAGIAASAIGAPSAARSHTAWTRC
jgi:hypothetical protein